MRFLMVDQITSWTKDARICGIKNVAMSEDFLEHHFPGRPVMPGALLLEAVGQLAGWLEAASSDFEHWLVVEQVDRCGYYGFALPGDQVELDIVAKGPICRQPAGLPRPRKGWRKEEDPGRLLGSHRGPRFGRRLRRVETPLQLSDPRESVVKDFRLPSPGSGSSPRADAAPLPAGTPSPTVARR